MYNVRLVVGNFFEEKTIQLFDLIRTDPNASGTVPDLTSRDGSFFVEVKSSSYNNGGVIKQRQLYEFDRIMDKRRFYAFVYHSIKREMQKNHPTEEKLKKALDLRSLFLFPFSIVRAHFENSQKRDYQASDYFVQLRETLARNIFEEDSLAWQHLGLKSKEYQRTQPHGKIHILTRGNNLKAKILNSFNPEFL